MLEDFKLTFAIIHNSFGLYFSWLHSLFYQIKFSATKIDPAVLKVNSKVGKVKSAFKSSGIWRACQGEGVLCGLTGSI